MYVAVAQPVRKEGISDVNADWATDGVYKLYLSEWENVSGYVNFSAKNSSTGLR